MAEDTVSTSSGGGSSQSTSTSTPIVVQTPQSQQSLTVSQTAEAMANFMLNWAMTNFNSGMGVTDQNIQQFLDQSGQAAGFANNLLNTYTNVFEPLMNEYVSAARDWASTARQQFNIGAAEAQANVADQAAIDNLKRNLTGAGININSGMYADLLKTAELQRAAAMAEQGTQAGLATQEQGMQYLQTANQMGQNVPGMWATAANTRTAALNAAQQALTSMLNTGANLVSPTVGLQTAASRILNPPTGQNTQGQSTSQQAQQSQSRGITPQQQQKQPTDQSGKGTGAGQGGPGTGPGYSTSIPSVVPIRNKYTTDQQDPGIPAADDGSSWATDPNLGAIPAAYNPQNAPWADPNMGNVIPPTLPNTNNGAVSPWSPDNPMMTTPLPNTFGGPSTATPAATDWGASQGQIPGVSQPTTPSYQAPAWQGPDQTSWQGAQPDLSGQLGIGDISSTDQTPLDTTPPPQSVVDQPPPDVTTPPDITPTDTGMIPPDTLDVPTDITAPPVDSFSDPSGGFFARGGVVPTTGGYVPRSASPSGGRQTDDIPARLNADEFVIPKDVVHHLGSKHFEGLIKKSRMARTGMSGPPARPTMKPPIGGKPRFVSQYMR